MNTEDEICCSICSLGDNLITTNCLHEFHLSCLLAWNARNAKMNVDTGCPLCRTVLLKAEPGRVIRTGHESTGHAAGHADLQRLLSALVVNTASNPAESDCAKMLRLITNNKQAELSAWIVQTPCIVNLQMSQGMSPLHHCIFNRQFHLMDILIASGASVRKQNAFGITPLMLAILIDNTNCVRKILNKRCDIDTQDKNGETALYYAVKTHDTTVVNLLCRLNADVNICNAMGETVYHLIASGSYTNNMITALKRCNPSCLNMRDSTGETVLHVAVDNQNIAFLRKFKNLMDPKMRLVTNYHGELPEELLDEVDEFESIRDFFSHWQIVAGAIQITINEVDTNVSTQEDSDSDTEEVSTEIVN